jgi:transcription termination/antitermination protein NusA
MLGIWNMNSELVAMVEYLEQEKAIDKAILFDLIEDAMASVYEKEVEEESEIKVEINRRTGDVTIIADVTVVEEVFDKRNEIDLPSAQKEYGDEIAIGDIVKWTLQQDQMSRIAAQNTRQAIMQRLRTFEKDRVVEEYSDMVGELISGTVRHFEKNELIVDFGRAQGGLGKMDRVPRERFDNGDHITALLKEIDPRKSGPSIVLSRTDAKLVTKLFEREVTEITNGLVEIKGVARKAGFRTKIAVASDSLDPVGACIGIRGSRVKTICQELNNEKLDIIGFSEDVEEYVREAFKPNPIEEVDIDDDGRLIKLMVSEESYRSIVGRDGENIRLTEELMDWDIEVEKYVYDTEITFDEHIQEAFQTMMKLPSMEEGQARMMIDAGYLSLEGVSEASTDDLVEAGISADQASEFIEYAKSRLQ